MLRDLARGRDSYLCVRRFAFAFPCDGLFHQRADLTPHSLHLVSNLAQSSLSQEFCVGEEGETCDVIFVSSLKKKKSLPVIFLRPLHKVASGQERLGTSFLFLFLQGERRDPSLYDCSASKTESTWEKAAWPQCEGEVVIGVLALVILCVKGIWYWMRSGTFFFLQKHTQGILLLPFKLTWCLKCTYCTSLPTLVLWPWKKSYRSKGR